MDGLNGELECKYGVLGWWTMRLEKFDKNEVLTPKVHSFTKRGISVEGKRFWILKRRFNSIRQDI